MKKKNMRNENDRKERRFISMTILLCVNGVDVVMFYAFVALMHAHEYNTKCSTHSFRWMLLCQTLQSNATSRQERGIMDAVAVHILLDGERTCSAEQLSVHAKWTNHLSADCRLYRNKFQALTQGSRSIDFVQSGHVYRHCIVYEEQSKQQTLQSNFLITMT